MGLNEKQTELWVESEDRARRVSEDAFSENGALDLSLHVMKRPLLWEGRRINRVVGRTGKKALDFRGCEVKHMRQGMKSKKIRIAYDVSACGELYSGSGEYRRKITTVSRAIENIADRLVASDEFELSMTGCYGGDSQPALTNAKARIYWEECWREKRGAGQRVPFLEAVRSRTGLLPAYYRAFVESSGWERPKISRLKQIWRSGLRKLAQWDAKPREMAGGLDLFHSPYRPLPKQETTGGVPLVMTVYDLMSCEGLDDLFHKKRLREVYKRFDLHRGWAICASESVRKDFCAATGVAMERTAVARLAAEPVFRPIPERVPLQRLFSERKIPDGPYFLGVSSPQPHKNLPFLIRCFQQIALEPGGEQLRLFLVGSVNEGTGQADIDRQIDAISCVKDRIFQLGAVSDEELALLYSHCTAFVFPSLSEGFALPPLEAMQCGAPVISSNTASLPEVTGDAALMLDLKDERTLIEAMREIVLNPHRRSELSARGIRRAAQFSWDRTAEIVMETYRKALR